MSEKGLISPRLIALDWGTSSLRAYLMSNMTEIIDSRHAAWGIMNLPEGGFVAALQAICGDWMRNYPALPMLAAGMVGSAQGWREAPYATAPLDARDVARGLVSVDTGGGRLLHIVPGVIAGGALPNVMRGEETQILGALQLDPRLAGEALIVLPGTHSKWVHVQAGRIENFTTFMTGEMFAALRQHTILGRLMPTADKPGAEDEEIGFQCGLEVGKKNSTGFFSSLFTVRTLGLTKQLKASQLSGYLSGLLIGFELAEARQAFPENAFADSVPLILIGDEQLCLRYKLALKHFGFRYLDVTPDHAGQAGLWQVASAAGLI